MNECNYVTVDGIKRPAREPPRYTDDRLWFASHPRRQFRLRPPFPGEPCLRDFHDAAQRIAAAHQSGFIVAILVAWQGQGRFVRAAGTFLADSQTMDSFTDAGIERLIEAPAAAYFTASRDGELLT